MHADVEIKQFQLSDHGSLFSFLRRVYPDEPRKSDPQFWTWHFLKNPYTYPEDIPLWLVKRGSEVVGQLGTIPVELKVGVETTRAIWILDFIVHQDYRGQGLGKRLVQNAARSYPTMITLGINEQSTRVFRSLGWAPLGCIHRYQKLIFPGHAIAEIAKMAPLRALANLTYAPARARLRALGGGRVVQKIDLFDAAFDDLWRRASNQWPCAVTRGSRILNWQFRCQPGKEFEVFGAYSAGILSGYIVLFFRRPNDSGSPPKVAITDLCYEAEAPDLTIDALIAVAIQRALATQVGSIVIDIRDARVETRLKHYGFWRIKKSPQFMASASEREDLLYQPDNWYLTRADSDISIFEQPNLSNSQEVRNDRSCDSIS